MSVKRKPHRSADRSLFWALLKLQFLNHATARWHERVRNVFVSVLFCFCLIIPRYLFYQCNTALIAPSFLLRQKIYYWRNV